ncbi:hypothetical protein [Halobacillus sp. Marseille-Q1614]|uniref:hypothetical protein n=1 Tax=Halobacillus sp. Marseille-Q1614 TaxID=2709134 RepID=UPI00156D4A0F|nr:hypothetical protein [Halobacillus sp. Marseille-Q1614]
MLKSHPINLIGTIILLLVVGVWLIVNFGYIEEHHLEDAIVEAKSKDEDGHYITVNNEKLLVKDKTLWMVIKEGEPYEVIYESYGLQPAYVVEIDQANDDESLGGGH